MLTTGNAGWKLPQILFGELSSHAGCGEACSARVQTKPAACTLLRSVTPPSAIAGGVQTVCVAVTPRHTSGSESSCLSWRHAENGSTDSVGKQNMTEHRRGGRDSRQVSSAFDTPMYLVVTVRM